MLLIILLLLLKQTLGKFCHFSYKLLCFFIRSFKRSAVKNEEGEGGCLGLKRELKNGTLLSSSITKKKKKNDN